MTALLAATRPTVPDVAVYVVCAVVVLSGAVGVVTSRNPVHAALSLVLTLFGVAVLFIEQDAQFLAAVQVIVYAGAIVVLFLFVIMFLGVDRQEDLAEEPLRGQRPLAFVMIAVSLGSVLALSATAGWVTGAKAVAGSTTAGGHTNTYLLGKSVFTTYLWAFEVTAALLVIAVVGAVVLARRSSREPDVLEEPRVGSSDGDGGDGGPGGGAGPGDAVEGATREGAVEEGLEATPAGTGRPEAATGAGRAGASAGEVTK